MAREIEPGGVPPRASGGGATSAGLAEAARRLQPVVLFVVLPLLLALVRLSDLHDRFDTFGFDFRGTLWKPAGDLLDGSSPYPSATDAASLTSGNPSVYPPLPITLAIPLARLGFDAALAIWLVVLATAVAGAIWIVGVRDWRCYSLALLCPPVVEGLFFGNVTLLLMLSLAAAWRWRAQAVKTGLAVGAAVAVKPLVVALVAWLLLTRRYLAAGVSVAAGVALVVVPWAAIGFDGFRDYPHLLDRLEATYGPGTDTLPAALSWLVSGHTARQLVCLAAALALVAVAARLRRRPDGDLCVFATMVGASVVAAPIVWPHYLALLLVPLAVARPRASAVWALPYTLPLVLAIDGRVLRASGFILLALAMTALPLLHRTAPRRGLREPSPLRPDAQGSPG